jgi:hypothetical protein
MAVYPIATGDIAKPVFLVDPATGLPYAAGSSSSTPSFVLPASSATGTETNVAAAIAATSLLAANANRRPGSTVANDGTAILYILLGTGTVSVTNYTVAIAAKTTVAGVYFLPDGFTGAVSGIWSAANGSARITEITA